MNDKEEKQKFVNFEIDRPKRVSLDRLYERMSDDFIRINEQLAKIDDELTELFMSIERRKG